MKFFALTWLAVGVGFAQFPAPASARPAKGPVFSDLNSQTAGLFTNSQPTPSPASATAKGSLIPTNVAAPDSVSLRAYVADDRYKLRAGDKISLQIIEDRDLQPKSLLIADSGELDAPYIGRVAAVDKTCKQLASEMKALLEKDYYHATVIIALDAANKVLGRIYVTGQVKNQGPIDMAINENLTASRAIMRAGGFGDFANKKKVKVLRGAGPNGAAGSKQTFELNMIEILDDGKTEKDVALQPDDWIIVPSRLINF